MCHSDAVWFHWMALAVVIVANVTCNGSMLVDGRLATGMMSMMYMDVGIASTGSRARWPYTALFNSKV